MKRGDKDGMLILAVNRGNEIDVEYSKKEIISKINSYFGYQLINEIKLQTSNIEEKKYKVKKLQKKIPENVEKKINSIKNKSIKNSLFELLYEIKND